MSDNSNHSIRDENGLTAAMRGRIQSKARREQEKEIKKQAKIAAKQMAQVQVKEYKKKMLEVQAAGAAPPKRTIEQMQELGFDIINQELQRLLDLSNLRGLNDFEAATLTKLMTAINTTAKTKQTLSPEADETKQRDGETIEEYKARLERAAQ